MESAYLGIDVGSISVNLAVIDEGLRPLTRLYLRSQGQPLRVMQEGLRAIAREVGRVMRIR